MSSNIDWKPGPSSMDNTADMPPEIVAEMAPLMATQDSAGMEALIQRVIGPIPNWRDLTFTNTRTGIVAHRSLAGVWSFHGPAQEP